ncbi:TniQ family protein [Chromohalobacter israelensis]|uniref:TniQ family protein n=1 Tax=Chromohalobacter israelensis TaxID=141390 RepID=UPI000D70ABB7|nr:TniQ family protein [Chromohalobacter salexigens]PWW31526.1 TniQ protein [Chromohalobacter salexigens]
MKPVPRWPLHPAPVEGEALSSWLRRVAACYQMEVHDLLAHDLGHGQVDDLDTAPPLSLLTVLSQRSGIELDRLRCMSVAGWVPWLLDSLDDQVPAALETYAFQCSVLQPRHKRKTRTVARWRAWLPRQPVDRACPLCLNDPADQAILLAWKLPLMLSCPLHGCWLEAYWGIPGRFLRWENTTPSPRAAGEAITAMDQRSWQALTMGYVELPRRRVHAGLWFRLLRSVLDELNTPLSYCGKGAGSIRYVWERCGHPPRAGQNQWRPYEMLDTVVQLQMLEAAATAIDLLESQVVIPRGEQAGLFLPEPQTGFSRGLPVKERQQKPIHDWKKMVRAINEAFAEARYNPETARSLFALAASGKRDPDSLERLRDEFAQEGIPQEFLSHYEPDVPFACRKISDSLSSKF